MDIINNYLEEQTNYQIFCDLDGVLTDFKRAVQMLGKGTLEELEQKKILFPIIIKYGKIGFWSEMPWMPDGKKLWKFIKSYRPTILTTPLTTINSKQGKQIWVRKKLGSNVPLVMSFKKEKYATPNSILIDDMEKNINPWIKAGGIGILHKNTKTTISKLKRLL